MSEPETTAFVLCIRNDGYEASLELRKVYQVVPDEDAAPKALLRILDESGEDYLYPRAFFVPIGVPAEANAAFGTHT